MHEFRRSASPSRQAWCGGQAGDYALNRQSRVSAVLFNCSVCRQSGYFVHPKNRLYGPLRSTSRPPQPGCGHRRDTTTLLPCRFTPSARPLRSPCRSDEPRFSSLRRANSTQRLNPNRRDVGDRRRRLGIRLSSNSELDGEIGRFPCRNDRSGWIHAHALEPIGKPSDESTPAFDFPILRRERRIATAAAAQDLIRPKSSASTFSSTQGAEEPFSTGVPRVRSSCAG